MSDIAKQLDALLKEAGLVVQFGLVNQGRMPRVVEMLAAGEGWGDIGRTIGWDGKAAAESFEMEFGIILERLKAAEAHATAAEQEQRRLAAEAAQEHTRLIIARDAVLPTLAAAEQERDKARRILREEFDYIPAEGWPVAALASPSTPARPDVIDAVLRAQSILARWLHTDDAVHIDALIELCDVFDVQKQPSTPSPAPSILGIPVKTHAAAPLDQIALVKEPCPCLMFRAECTCQSTPSPDAGAPGAEACNCGPNEACQACVSLEQEP